MLIKRKQMDRQYVSLYIYNHHRYYLRLFNYQQPIFGAAYRGHQEIVDILIDAGCDARSPRPDGVTASSLAAQEGHANILKSLVRGNADINIARDDGATPVYMAARHGCVDTLGVLIDAGADVSVSMIGESEGASPVYETFHHSKTFITPTTNTHTQVHSSSAWSHRSTPYVDSCRCKCECFNCNWILTFVCVRVFVLESFFFFSFPSN